MIKTVLSCASILGGFVGGHYNIPITSIDAKNSLTLRPAIESDVQPTTDLIHEAYRYWSDHGVIVSPATQPESTTQRHLLNGKGFVATDSADKIRATFSLDDVEIASAAESSKIRASGGNSFIDFEKASGIDEKLLGRYLEFKKLAVDPSISGHGIGRSLYDVAEKYARSERYAGLALETVKEATWLYDWYIKLGFKVYGKYIYPGSKLETLLLIKKFQE